MDLYIFSFNHNYFLSLFQNTKTNAKDIEAIILLSKNILEFVKEKKIYQELQKINKMPFPENTIKFLKKYKELNLLSDFL